MAERGISAAADLIRRRPVAISSRIAKVLIPYPDLVLTLLFTGASSEHRLVGCGNQKWKAVLEDVGWKAVNGGRRNQ